MNRIIAITGGIGSGKSVVARVLGCMGYEIYDCDSQARQIMEESEDIKLAIGAVRPSPPPASTAGFWLKKFFRTRRLSKHSIELYTAMYATISKSGARAEQYVLWRLPFCIHQAWMRWLTKYGK